MGLRVGVHQLLNTERLSKDVCLLQKNIYVDFHKFWEEWTAVGALLKMFERMSRDEFSELWSDKPYTVS